MTHKSSPLLVRVLYSSSLFRAPSQCEHSSRQQSQAQIKSVSSQDAVWDGATPLDYRFPPCTLCFDAGIRKNKDFFQFPMALFRKMSLVGIIGFEAMLLLSQTDKFHYSESKAGWKKTIKQLLISRDHSSEEQ